VQFFLVYIREAHAIDGDWPMFRVLVEDPVTDTERKSVATTCITNLDLGGMPALLDGVDDKTNHDYAAHPDRLFLVGRDGKIAYAGGKGPFGFKPHELEQAILAETGRTADQAILGTGSDAKRSGRLRRRPKLSPQ
jgi:hypothetical protein